MARAVEERDVGRLELTSLCCVLSSSSSEAWRSSWFFRRSSDHSCLVFRGGPEATLVRRSIRRVLVSSVVRGSFPRSTPSDRWSRRALRVGLCAPHTMRCALLHDPLKRATEPGYPPARRGRAHRRAEPQPPSSASHPDDVVAGRLAAFDVLCVPGGFAPALRCRPRR